MSGGSSRGAVLGAELTGALRGIYRLCAAFSAATRGNKCAAWDAWLRLRHYEKPGLLSCWLDGLWQSSRWKFVVSHCYLCVCVCGTFVPDPNIWNTQSRHDFSVWRSPHAHSLIMSESDSFTRISVNEAALCYGAAVTQTPHSTCVDVTLLLTGNISAFLRASFFFLFSERRAHRDPLHTRSVVSKCPGINWTISDWMFLTKKRKGKKDIHTSSVSWNLTAAGGCVWRAEMAEGSDLSRLSPCTEC